MSNVQQPNELNEGLALALALAESEVKRKRLEGTVAQMRQVIAQQQKAQEDQAKEIKTLKEKIEALTPKDACAETPEALN